MPLKKWIHYAIDTVALFVGFYLGDKFIHLSQLNLWQMYLFWFFVVVTSDRLVHKYYLKSE